jgi:hypothetical protein
LSLCFFLTEHHATRRSGGVELYLHAFLISTPDGGEWSASRPGCFTPRVQLLTNSLLRQYRIFPEILILSSSLSSFLFCSSKVHQSIHKSTTELCSEPFQSSLTLHSPCYVFSTYLWIRIPNCSPL